MKSKVKQLLLSTQVAQLTYGWAHSARFDYNYRKIREHYEVLARNSPLAYDAGAAINRAREKIKARGYSVPPRRPGEVHTFAYIPSNWPHQSEIVNGLRRIGRCTRYDYKEKGVLLAQLADRTAAAKELRFSVLDDLRRHIRKIHREDPIDWFFSYSLGWDMTGEIITAIQEEFGFPTVNISLDDKNWWGGIVRGDPESGLKTFAPKYDLAWTSASVATSWYWAEDGQAIFLPEGVNTDKFRPLDIQQDIDVGFIGSKFGFRSEMIKALKRAGLSVVVHGEGWRAGPLEQNRMIEFFNRCRINLGHGDMSYSRWLTNLKGRDFEIPATGKGIYLSTYNSDLARCFHIGQEIQCYRGIDELIEMIRYYLRHTEESIAIANKGRRRCEKEHQWHHRYGKILAALGILSDIGT